MKFKKGDKVRVIGPVACANNVYWPLKMYKTINKIYKVIEVYHNNNRYFLSSGYFYPNVSIEPAIKVGQQLLFPFMEE